MEEVNLTDTNKFWEWLRKRGESQHENRSSVEVTLELPQNSTPIEKKKVESDEESSPTPWTDVDYTIYKL